jgi:hypothetical protein
MNSCCLQNSQMIWLLITFTWRPKKALRLHGAVEVLALRGLERYLFSAHFVCPPLPGHWNRAHRFLSTTIDFPKRTVLFRAVIAFWASASEGTVTKPNLRVG